MFQSNVKFYLKSTIEIADSTSDSFLVSEDFELGEVIDTDGEIVSMVLRNARQIERFEITVAAGLATIVKRGLDQSETSTEDAALKKQWTEGTIGYITALAFDFVDNQNAAPIRLTIPTVADPTARDALYPTPTGGEIVKVTSLGGIMQTYNSVTAQWETLDVGTPTPIASVIASGTVEISTSAQSIDGTDTGETGSKLSVLPSDIAKNSQSGTFLYAADAGGDDTYVFALTPVLAAYTTGQLLRGKVATANTGACTADFWPWVKSIKKKNGMDPESGEVSVWIHDFIYDGVNLILQSPNTAPKFWGTGADGAISGALTITGSNNSYIVKNYTTFAPWANIVTITPTNCILHIKVQGDCDLTNTTFSFSGKGGLPWVWGNAGVPTAGTSGSAWLTNIPTANLVGAGGVWTFAGAGGWAGANVMNASILLASVLWGKFIPIGAGGGGGGGERTSSTNGGAGGGGGGCLILEVGWNIVFTGSVATFTGANWVAGASGSGGAGGGWGGGGGSFVCIYNGTATGSLTPTVTGGTGGAGGTGASSPSGGGGGGASIITSWSAGANPAGAGGAGGNWGLGTSLIQKNIDF